MTRTRYKDKETEHELPWSSFEALKNDVECTPYVVYSQFNGDDYVVLAYCRQQVSAVAIADEMATGEGLQRTVYVVDTVNMNVVYLIEGKLWVEK